MCFCVLKTIVFVIMYRKSGVTRVHVLCVSVGEASSDPLNLNPLSGQGLGMSGSLDLFLVT